MALGLSSIFKARLLKRLLGDSVVGWRWSLGWAAGAALIVGVPIMWLPDWFQLSLGAPLVLIAFGAMLWSRGFTSEDRVLFRLRRDEEPSLPNLAP